MKIVILCPFSYPSICGVWTRAYNDAKYLVKQDHEVHIFSSNKIKGTNQTSDQYELLEGIHIHRFRTIMSWGENTNFWFFTKKLKKINPNIIHSHVYRHPETNISAFLAKTMKKPFVLTTHAPFVEKKLRGKLMNIMVNFHDKILSKIFFNLCSKVITITQWEIPYLKEINCPENKIIYLPNGIEEDFFKLKPKRNNKEIANIMFFGRIAPIKNIECLIKAAKILKDEKTKFKLTIIGIPQEEYFTQLKSEISKQSLEKEIEFKLQTKVNTIQEKLNFYKENNILVLPSHREAMPFVLLEAMASGLTVISSKTLGGLEIIENNKTGYLFEIDNENELAEKIKLAIKISLNAQKEIKKFTLNRVNPLLEKLYKSLIEH